MTSDQIADEIKQAESDLFNLVDRLDKAMLAMPVPPLAQLKSDVSMVNRELAHQYYKLQKIVKGL